MTSFLHPIRTLGDTHAGNCACSQREPSASRITLAYAGGGDRGGEQPVGGTRVRYWAATEHRQDRVNRAHEQAFERAQDTTRGSRRGAEGSRVRAHAPASAILPLIPRLDVHSSLER